MIDTASSPLLRAAVPVIAILILAMAAPALAQQPHPPQYQPPPPPPPAKAAPADPIGTKIEELQHGRKAAPLPAKDLIARSNAATFTSEPLRPELQSPMVVKLQVMLDRQNVSPGVIDGYYGNNLAKAIAAFQTMHGLPADGVLSQSVWSALEQGSQGPVLVDYTVRPEDVAGPFVRVMPTDYAEMAKLERLAYRGPAELLAEKFHMDEEFLRRLNPGVTFETAGQAIVVADIRKPATAKVARLVADKGSKQLLGYDDKGALIVAYPATIGTDDLPSPTGTHAIKNVVQNPDYSYRPQVNFQQGNNTKPLTLPPGPNNPVGAVWIGLDAPTYGIHGSPSPDKIDKARSHGCVRLTNWDVQELAKTVRPGVLVEFVEARGR